MQPLFMEASNKIVKNIISRLENENRNEEAKSLLIRYLTVKQNIQKNYYNDSDVHQFIVDLVKCLEEENKYIDAKMIMVKFLSFNDAFNLRNKMLVCKEHYEVKPLNESSNNPSVSPEGR